MQKILKAKIGFGTYRILNQDEMNKAIEWAIQYKYDFIDTAKLYGTEPLVGKALKLLKKNKTDFTMPLIQSKVWPSDFKNGIKYELTKSLKRIGITKIDSFMLHRPHVDNSKNVSAWKELIKCQKEGIVDVIGVSNFEPDMIRILINETGVCPQVVQNEASVSYIRRDRMVFCNEHNIIMQGWRPFGNGSVNFKSPIVEKLAKKYKCTKAQILLSYSIGNGFCPIPRSSIEKELSENTMALKVKLNENDLHTLEHNLNMHKSTTHNECDSYANLALNDSWYKTH